MSETPPSEETPVYAKVQHQAGRLFMITCDEGWRSTILCDSMHEEDADWLLTILDRKPRRVAPERPAEDGRSAVILADEIRHSGYQGAAAHTFTTTCDGFHPISEQCNLPSPQ